MEHYLFWIILSFCYPLLYGFNNIINGLLINKLFPNKYVLIFFKSITNLLFVPLILFWGMPSFPGYNFLFLYFILGTLDLVYVIPYYNALKNIDTSIVGALFSLGRILIPIMTYFFLGEQLKLSQYIGFSLIVLSSLALSIKNFHFPKINKAFYLMLLSSAIRSVFAVIEKYTINADGNWINKLVYPPIFTTLLPCLLLFSSKYRKLIAEKTAIFKSKIFVFLSMELFSFIALAVMFYILPHISAVLKTSISSTMPIFILLTQIVLNKFFGIVTIENLTKFEIIKKFVLFILMSVGVYYVIM